jgi:D-tyrosyl-tRNA(Tyr) deacylase
MRAVVTRVRDAAVSVDGETVARIGPGLLILLGVTHSDTRDTATAMARKIAGLRILRGAERDELSVLDAGGSALVVSQFTLYGDTGAGRRPSWKAAAPGSVAEPLVRAVVEDLCALSVDVHAGRFGATMDVTSTNDGPLTLVLDIG